MLVSLLVISSTVLAYNSNVLGMIRFLDYDAIPGQEFSVHANIKNVPESVKVYAFDNNGNPIPNSYEIKTIEDVEQNKFGRTITQRSDRKKYDDLRVKMYFMDDGDVVVGRGGDLYPGEKGSRILSWDVPNNMESGEYLVRIVASSDKVRTVKHRYITVI